MRIRPIIAALAFGVVMNYATAWFCVWQYDAGTARPLWRRGEGTPLMVSDASWPMKPKPGWPQCPSVTVIENLGWVVEQSALWEVKADGNSLRVLMSRTDAGWPFRSVWRGWASDAPRSTVAGTGSRRASVLLSGQITRWTSIQELPIGILPGPFLLNSLFYALFAWLTLLAWFVLVDPAAMKRHRRASKNLCPTCAYPIGTSSICTECGQPLPPRTLNTPPTTP